MMKFEEAVFPKEWDSKELEMVGGGSAVEAAEAAEAAESGEAAEAVPSDAALGALLEEAAADEDDAERRVQRLGSQLARLDALNVAGMLAAATESGGAGATLAARLEAGLAGGAALQARLRRCAALARGAPDAVHARSGAARADAHARALLAELDALYRWLDAPPLRDLDSLPEVSLGSAEGRARALAAALALRAALRAERSAAPHLRRLAACRERLRRLARAKEQLAAALARHLNNALIHLGNEAAQDTRAPRHHAELAPYAPFMRWLKDMDEKAFDALTKVYASTWSRVYERAVRAACEAARAAPPPGAGAGAGAGVGAGAGTDAPLDRVLELVETLCNAEQEFCTQFFCLDVDPKAESAGEAEGAGGIGAGAEGEREREEARRAAGESRRLMGELFPSLEADLVALVGHLERQDPYGAMRALACVGRRVLEAGAGAGAGVGAGGGWARAALAGAAVAAKRGADRAVAERAAALAEGVRQAARRHKCGVFPFIPELEALSAVCEGIFPAGGRRADLDRWYLALATAIMHAIQHADHPRTPRAVLHMENYHRLHGVVSSLRVAAPALEGVRRECRARYADALKAYVTHYFGRPLEKLTQFFEGVAEAVAMGVPEEEVCYRAAFSKHELRRVLALYPAAEVRRALHRLYRTVEKHLSEEGGLLQVVWRAMQEEFIAQHVQLQARIAACYPAAGLALPLTTQHILDAFSDIAREH